MTAICGGGTSSPLPGFNAAVQVSTFMLGALANNWPVAWAVAYAGLLGGVQYDLTNMCVVDPPADPGFTAADGLAMLNGFSVDANAFTNASLKLQQLLKRFAWYQFCQCDSVATPAAPAPPAAPVGLPIANPPITATNQACFNWNPPTRQRSQEASASSLDDYVGTSNPTISYAQVPDAATTVTATVVITETSGASDTYQLQLRWGNGTELGLTGAQSCNVTGSGTCTVTAPRVAGKTGVRSLVLKQTTVAGTYDCTVTAAAWCGTTPGGPQGNCNCPPDLITQGVLHQILDLVTLIQRQNVPFAYVTGTAHAGLSGTGSFTIPALVGVKVAVTTIPSSIGRLGTSPTEYFDAGFLTFGTPDGYDHSYRVEHNPELILPARCSAFTTLAYDLPPGVVVTITELKREP